MTRMQIFSCDRCGAQSNTDKPTGWMWTQRYDGIAESNDLCAACVAEVFKPHIGEVKENH